MLDFGELSQKYKIFVIPLQMEKYNFVLKLWVHAWFPYVQTLCMYNVQCTTCAERHEFYNLFYNLNWTQSMNDWGKLKKEEEMFTVWIVCWKLLMKTILKWEFINQILEMRCGSVKTERQTTLNMMWMVSIWI